MHMIDEAIRWKVKIQSWAANAELISYREDVESGWFNKWATSVVRAFPCSRYSRKRKGRKESPDLLTFSGFIAFGKTISRYGFFVDMELTEERPRLFLSIFSSSLRILFIVSCCSVFNFRRLVRKRAGFASDWLELGFPVPESCSDVFVERIFVSSALFEQGEDDCALFEFMLWNAHPFRAARFFQFESCGLWRNELWRERRKGPVLYDRGEIYCPSYNNGWSRAVEVWLGADSVAKFSTHEIIRVVNSAATSAR